MSRRYLVTRRTVEGVQAWVEGMFGGEGDLVLEVVAKDRQRSLAQNRKFWAMMRDLSEQTGYTPNQMHDIVLADIYGDRSFEFGGKTYHPIAKTSQFSVEMMESCIEMIGQWALEMGLMIND